MSLRWKIIVPSLAVVLVTSTALFAIYHHDAEQRTRDLFVGTARSIVLAAESAKEDMAAKWELGVFSSALLSEWARKGEVEKIIAAIPVVSGWKTARAKAREGGYEFRVPKFSPRKPENEPDEIEARVLKMFKHESVKEYYEIDESRNAIRYFRPIRLTKTCLLCHGDPATSVALWNNDQGLDPTGARMENWKVGEVHGAFEVIHSLDEADSMLAASLWRGIRIVALVVIVGLGLLYWLITRGVLRRIWALTAVSSRISQGDLSERIVVAGRDELAELAGAVDGVVVGLAGVVEQADTIARGDYSVEIEPRSDKDALGVALFEMTRTLRDVVRVCEAVAVGDYSAKVIVKGDKDLLGQALNEMINNLSILMEQINSAGAQMVSASREQAEGAKNQSVATEEMSATVSELLASARKMTENAGRVSEQAELAANECTSGRNSVEGAVQGIKGVHERVAKIATHMLELGSKSQQISGVLDIISELSEQTNLLSLNASIEAAGAGEAGKRFAVVASEIRKLAERAADSTGEIRALIDGVQETVNATIMATEQGTKAIEEGVSLTEAVDKSFGRIAQQVASTTQSAKAIEMGSRQQATAVEQMEGAVRNVDTTAQQTAETANQLNASARALLKTARTLQGTK